nr:hybrid signal transduction histidine kinase M [Tanacetum cinerariifolium]
MAGDDTPPPNPPPTSTDKLIPFSISNKVPIKLDLEKHNCSSWSSFFIIHLDSIGLKTHVGEEALSSNTNPEWCKLDDIIKLSPHQFLYVASTSRSSGDEVEYGEEELRSGTTINLGVLV